MKAKIIIVLAAVAMLLTACTKEKTHKNELTWNGDTQQLMSSVGIRNYGTTYDISGWTELEEGHDHPAYSFDCEICKVGLNNTYDLARGHYYDSIGYLIYANKFYSPDKHWFYNNCYTAFSNDWGGHINGVNFENTSIFKSGTMTITLDDEGLTLSLDGVLKDDDTFTVDLYIPKEEFINR